MFDHVLICVKDKKGGRGLVVDEFGHELNLCALKGLIHVRKDLQEVRASQEESVLSLSLTASDLQFLHVKFRDQSEFHQWHKALRQLQASSRAARYIAINAQQSFNEDTEFGHQSRPRGDPMLALAPRSPPLDLVVAVVLSPAAYERSLGSIRDAIQFLVANLGREDRMELVTTGIHDGGGRLVKMRTKKWSGWNDLLRLLRPMQLQSQDIEVADVVEAAMDVLMQREEANPVSSIIVISDDSISDTDSVDRVAHAAAFAGVTLYTLGVAQRHRPDSLIELASRTDGSYLYVMDFESLRDCVAGVLGSIQSISHTEVKLHLELPEGTSGKVFSIAGASSTTKRVIGRAVEVSVGDLRFGDRRDILVQVIVNVEQSHIPADHRYSTVSVLDALENTSPANRQRSQSRLGQEEELPLLQARLSFQEFLDNGSTTTTVSQPAFLAIVTIPPRSSEQLHNDHQISASISAAITRRRAELLTTDMLRRALALTSRGQDATAQRLLEETRTILHSLVQGGVSSRPQCGEEGRKTQVPETKQTVSRLDARLGEALAAEITACLDGMHDPSMFVHHTRKAVLQTVDVLTSQRAFTFRSAVEAMLAGRVDGVGALVDGSRQWFELGVVKRK